MNSIRRQLTRESLAVFLVLLGGSLAALYSAARDELIEQFDDALRTKGLAISSLTLQEEKGVRIDVADQLFHSFTKERPRDFFEIRNASGEPVARSASLGGANLPSPPPQLNHRGSWDLFLPDGRPGRAFTMSFVPVMQEGEHQANSSKTPLSIVVASDRDNLDEVLTELLSIGGACGVLGFGITLWLVPRVLRRGLQPLDRLGEQAARIDADSLTTRFPAGDLPAELQPIADRLNELLARLEVSFERERRFSADLAHELRTPLAELRSLAECALKWPETRGQAADLETLAIATQMQTIVTSLLALTRGEQQQLASRKEPIDLTALAQECWQPFAGRAEQRQLKINWALTPAQAQADPALLRSILGNLFDNAVDYAPVGGEVSIRLEAGGSGATLRVANVAEGLEPGDVARLFDRFWRKEEARSGGRHFGLGLPLARMFAQAMGWTLTATMDEQRRLEFTLSGPAAGPLPGNN